MENWQYLVGAYSIAWVGVTYFVYRALRKQRLTEQRLEDLKNKFEGQ